MEAKITGRAWVYGDNIDTDVIIPARYLSTADPAELAKHCMEDIDSTFVQEVKKGDIVVGGANFGCGSSREHAPLAFIGAGVSAIIAGSFARIFFRNSINVGLPILECPECVGKVKKGDVLSIDTTTGTITNQTSGETFQAQPFPPFLSELINDGGLVEYARKQLASR